MSEWQIPGQSGFDIDSYTVLELAKPAHDTFTNQSSLQLGFRTMPQNTFRLHALSSIVARLSARLVQASQLPHHNFGALQRPNCSLNAALFVSDTYTCL